MSGRAIRIQGDPAVVEDIAALIQENDDAQYIRTELDDSGGIGADFILETIATLIAIASALFFDGPIVPQLYSVLHRHRGTRISIETSGKTVVIKIDGDFSEEKLRNILIELMKA